MPKKSQSVLEQLLEATEANPQGKKEDEQEFLLRLSESVSELEQADWDALGDDAQEWYNAAVDASNEGDEIPHPDAAAEPAKPAAKPAVERKTATKPAAKAAAKTPDPEPEPDDELELEDIEVGMKVCFVMKKGDDIVGEVTVAEDNSTTVEDEDGDEIDVLHKRVESVSLLEAPKKKAKAAGRATTKSAPEPEPEPAKKARVRGAVSVTGRIRDILCANTSLDRDGVAAQLTEEGIEFNPATLALQFTEVSRTIECLRALGKLKK